MNSIPGASGRNKVSGVRRKAAGRRFRSCWGCDQAPGIRRVVCTELFVMIYIISTECIPAMLDTHEPTWQFKQTISRIRRLPASFLEIRVAAVRLIPGHLRLYRGITMKRTSVLLAVIAFSAVASAL